MTYKFADHIRGGTTFHRGHTFHTAPVQIGGPAPVAPAARELPPIVAGTLRRLGLTAPPPGKKLALRDVDAAFAKSGMTMQARIREKSNLAFYGIIAA
jgi:hypothetical protein